MSRRVEEMFFVSSIVLQRSGRDSLCSFMRFFISSSLATPVARKIISRAVFLARFMAYLLLPLLTPPVMKMIFPICPSLPACSKRAGQSHKKLPSLLCAKKDLFENRQVFWLRDYLLPHLPRTHSSSGFWGFVSHYSSATARDSHPVPLVCLHFPYRIFNLILLYHCLNTSQVFRRIYSYLLQGRRASI